MITYTAEERRKIIERWTQVPNGWSESGGFVDIRVEEFLVLQDELRRLLRAEEKAAVREILATGEAE